MNTLKAKNKILIIDRHTSEVKQLIRTFRDINLDVVLCQEGQQAFDLCLSDQPSLILTELNLPMLNIEDFFKRLKGNFSTREIPVIATCKEMNLEERVKALEMGFDDFILKPYYPEEAAARIEMILNERELIDASRKSIARGFSGNLEELNLVDLIQTLELGEKSGMIILTRSGKEGQIFVKNGRVINAFINGVKPDRALTHMFTWLSGKFWVSLQEIETQQTIHESNEEILLKGTELIHQWRQIVGQLPPLNTVFEVIDENGDVSVTKSEKRFMSFFTIPKTIAQGIEESQLDDLHALRLVKSLLDKGLFVLKNSRKPTQATLTKEVPQVDRYTRLILAFRKGGGERSRGDVREESPRSSLNSMRSIQQASGPTLSKGDLMLIRQKLATALRV
jgi:DNA-binding response OmpR family regulator